MVRATRHPVVLGGGPRRREFESGASPPGS